MHKPFHPKVVTANHLFDGDVIYMNASQKWVRSLQQAHLLTQEDQANEWLDHAAQQVDHVVGAYLVDAKSGPNGPQPTHFREDFRQKGPSNYHHGKQEVA